MTGFEGMSGADAAVRWQIPGLFFFPAALIVAYLVQDRARVAAI